MKTHHIVPCLLLAAAAFFTACGNETSTTPATSSDEAPAVDLSTPKADASQTIEITGNDQMKFSNTEITVTAGDEVVIEFKNVGTMPKAAMGHNLVVLVQGTDAVAFANKGVSHADSDYIAPDAKNAVIAATKILGPGESETLTFVAPSEPGEYPFVCTFPAHAAAGMRGIITVK